MQDIKTLQAEIDYGSVKPAAAIDQFPQAQLVIDAGCVASSPRGRLHWRRYQTRFAAHNAPISRDNSSNHRIALVLGIGAGVSAGLGGYMFGNWAYNGCY